MIYLDAIVVKVRDGVHVINKSAHCVVTVAVPTSHIHHVGVSLEEREGTYGRHFRLSRR